MPRWDREKGIFKHIHIQYNDTDFHNVVYIISLFVHSFLRSFTHSMHIWACDSLSYNCVVLKQSERWVQIWVQTGLCGFVCVWACVYTHFGNTSLNRAFSGIKVPYSVSPTRWVPVLLDILTITFCLPFFLLNFCNSTILQCTQILYLQYCWNVQWERAHCLFCFYTAIWIQSLAEQRMPTMSSQNNNNKNMCMCIMHQCTALTIYI